MLFSSTVNDDPITEDHWFNSSFIWGRREGGNYPSIKHITSESIFGSKWVELNHLMSDIVRRGCRITGSNDIYIICSETALH